MELINPQFLLSTVKDFSWILKIEKIKEALTDHLKVILIQDIEIQPEIERTFSPITISVNFKINELTEAINRTYDFSNGWDEIIRDSEPLASKHSNCPFLER